MAGGAAAKRSPFPVLPQPCSESWDCARYPMRGRGVERGKARREQQGTSDLTKAPAGGARGREPAAATWSRAGGRVGLPTATAADTSTRAGKSALSSHAGTGSGPHLVGPEVAFAPVPPAVRAGGSGRNRSLGTWVPAWCLRVTPRRTFGCWGLCVLSGVFLGSFWGLSGDEGGRAGGFLREVPC